MKFLHVLQAKVYPYKLRGSENRDRNLPVPRYPKYQAILSYFVTSLTDVFEILQIEGLGEVADLTLGGRDAMDPEIYVVVVPFHCVDEFSTPPLRSLSATAARPLEKLSIPVPRYKRMDPFPGVIRVPEAANAKCMESGWIVQQPFLRLRIHNAEHDGYLESLLRPTVHRGMGPWGGAL